MNVEVKKLTPDLAESFLHFFDHVAFQDNERWASCYCYFYRREWADGEWDGRSAEENREAAVQWIKANGLNGYLAFADGEPVGWCHANDAQNVVKSADVMREPEAKTGVFVCFIVAPDQRGKGIATALLRAACAGFKAEGYQYVEGYPNKRGETVQDHYHGPFSMYEENGFEVAEDCEDRVVMRKTL
ncbi:acetyltransferase (GNAT) family protein [Tumebacillus sp. BK434]|uniref:GNAT family N-acetyltransferase n=1 Tax=Tumebacillus sp. BK434 TaxID=2512169 RepID=UPI0010F159A9|nr:GNAT family N-acetyltransferase [Tumebacillus sp. BK434]TCP58111.1 acetyltransferase (GNAT) family protein [Tumebacillus sp. BK434]